MMTAAELRELCKDFRYHARKTDDEIVARIRAEVDDYRAKFLTRPAPQLPPEPLRELLPLMGWLIYEASWYSIRQVQAAFESLRGDRRESSERAYRHIRQLANAARRLVWPEFAPRALGAIRAQALAESKRDTEEGYDDAYIVHQEAADRHQSYVDTHGNDPSRARYLLDLDEMLLQLALAETGTACRTAERVIGRWSEEFADRSGDDEEQWVQKMFLSLSDAIEIGGRALETAKKIKDRYGLVHEVDEYRLALVTGYRNPGIMTARAALLALALAPAMEHLERMPARASTWKEERADLIKRFTVAYQAIEAPVTGPEGETVPMALDHQRALVHRRLNLALLVPGQSLPSTEPFDPCLELDPLDDEAVKVMSRWLATGTTGGRPDHGNTIGAATHGNTIGAATLPLFIQSVVVLRSLTGDGAGYPAWRREWYELGRYAAEDGRRERVEAALTIAAGRPSLRISRE